MRHRKANVKLGRTASHRDAMLRNMVTSLFEYDRITATVSKANAVRALASKKLGLAKNGKGDLHSLRQAAAVIRKRTVLDKLFEEAVGRFSDRVSGYTVMVKTGLRKGDAAPMVILELVKAGQEKAKTGAGSPKKAKAGSSDRSRRVAQSAKKAAVDEAPVAAPAEEAEVQAAPAVEASAAEAPVAEASAETETSAPEAEAEKPAKED